MTPSALNDSQLDHLVTCSMSDDQYSNSERHESLVQILYHQVLPLITISQHEIELLHKASDAQQLAISKLGMADKLVSNPSGGRYWREEILAFPHPEKLK